MLPWVILPPCGTEYVSGLLQLFEPFSGYVGLKTRPAVVTFAGWEDVQTNGPGIYTESNNALEKPIICNFLTLSQNIPTQPAQFYPKQTFPVDPGRTIKLLHSLSLEFSDVICIKAQTVDDAVRTMFGFWKCARLDSIQVGPQFIMLIENFSPVLEIGEKRFREHLRSLIKEEDPGSRWMLNVVQRIIVQSYHPQSRSVAEVLLTLRNSIVTLRKKRKDRGHLWTYEEIMFLLEEYLTLKTSSTREDQILPIQTFGARSTWFPMAFRRQFWPGQEILKRNGLIKWLKSIPDNIDLEKFVAPIFARMFLEDRAILPQGT